MFELDPGLIESFQRASEEARRRNHPRITPYHLLFVISQNGESDLSKGLRPHEALLEMKLRIIPSQGDGDLPAHPMSFKLIEWLSLAEKRVKSEGRPVIKEEDLLAHLPRIAPELCSVT
jgi:ATP-dependent Clp protease ATP-binding subunit ClpA